MTQPTYHEPDDQNDLLAQCDQWQRCAASDVCARAISYLHPFFLVAGEPEPERAFFCKRFVPRVKR